MLKPNTENSNSQFQATQKSSSNTHLFLRYTLTLSTNSFNSFLSSLNKTQIEIPFLLIHLDYARLTSNGLTKKSFNDLLAYLGLPIPCFENKIAWHPHPKMPKSKQYQNSIVSKTGIVLGYTRRPLSKSKKPKYVYDIMIGLRGAYFTDLSLLEQINVICYLNTNWKLKCHRLDVAIDDYSRELFPVAQIVDASHRGDNLGFKEIDDTYLTLTSNGWSGTLGIGSRFSDFFVRIYTKHKYFVRWETELKRKKAQKLFDELASLGAKETNNIQLEKCGLKVLIDAAFGKIDFRDKSNVYSKNATRERTNQLPFWSEFKSRLYSLIEN